MQFSMYNSVSEHWKQNSEDNLLIQDSINNPMIVIVVDFSVLDLE